MKKLDRYIIHHFLFALGISALVLLGVYLVVHFFTSLQDFIQIHQENTFLFILKYYLCRLPLILLMLLPIITLVAAMLTVTKFIRDNEFIPVFSAGISIYRALLPVFGLALLISGLMFLLDEEIIPRLRQDLSRTDKILKSEGSDYNILTHDGMNSSIFIKEYDYIKKVMHKVSVTKCNKENKLEAKIIAETGCWEERENPGWYLYDGVAYSYDEQGLRKGLPERFAESGYLLTTDLTPEDMEKTGDILSYTEISDIRKLINRYPHQAYLKVKLYNKITFPLTNLILLALGLPFVLIGESRNFFIGIGICLSVGIIFFLVQFLFESLGTKGIIQPALATGAPLVLFGLIALILFRQVRT